MRQIFRINQNFKWLREPLRRRLPDGSLCCVFFTGGTGDGQAYPSGIPNANWQSSRWRRSSS